MASTTGESEFGEKVLFMSVLQAEVQVPGGPPDRGCGKVGIAGGDFQGAVGVVGNLGLVLRNSHGPVFSTAWLVTADQVRAVANRDCTIQVLMNGHRLAGQRMAPAAFVNLPPAILDGHGVVLAHHSFGLDREDPVQIAAPTATKRGAFFTRFHRELLVELGNIGLPQKAVGFLQGRDRG